MAGTRLTQPDSARPWWLADGDEMCAHCGQPYAYETEYRCVACDGAVCMHCVLAQGRSNHCPECPPEAG